jgi:hypothetical protein
LIAIALGAAACSFPAASPDGDPPSGVGFQFSSSLIDERVGTHLVVVALSEPVNDAVTVEVEVSGGTADEPDDFSLITSSITIPAGSDRADVELSVVEDAIEQEEMETIELRLSNATNAVVVHDTHTVSISPYILPRINFVEPTSAGSEDSGDKSFDFTLDIPSPRDVVVGYGVLGTVSSADHGLLVMDGQFTIPAGVVTGTLPAPITNDIFDEDDETLDVSFIGLMAVIAGTSARHVHTIMDEDPEPQLVFDAGSSSELENGGPAQTLVRVNLVPESGKDVTVTCAVTGGTAQAAEYALSNCGTLSFPAGTTQHTVAFTPADDPLYENNETVVIRLQAPNNASIGGQNDHTWTLLNDDTAPTIQFAAATSTPGEGDGSYNVVVTQSAASGLATTFNVTTTNISTTGADYTVNGGPYTIPAGMTQVNVPVAITGDNTDELDESFTLGLASITNATQGAQGTHGVTIIDDDVKVSFDPSEGNVAADEGNGSGTIEYFYTVTLDVASAQTVTVTFSVGGSAGGGDVSVLPAGRVLTFAPGVLTQDITVRVNRDNSGEGDDTVILTLSSAAFAQVVPVSTLTHTITNDD